MERSYLHLKTRCCSMPSRKGGKLEFLRFLIGTVVWLPGRYLTTVPQLMPVKKPTADAAVKHVFCLSLTSAQAVNKRQQIRRGGGFAGFLSKFRQCAGFCNELRGKKTVSIPSSLPPACLSSQEASSTCQWHHPRSPPVLSLLIQMQIHRCVYML